MKISIHLGAHCTDEDQLLRSLLKNSEYLLDQDVCVPGPSRYRGLISDALVKLAGQVADHETEEMILDALISSDGAKRLVIGHQNFLGAPHRALEHNTLYHLAQRNTVWQRNLFPSHEIEFFIALRNPATLVPALLSSVNANQKDALLAELDPYALHWSSVIEDIREANPDCPITVWCNEDSPMIWQEVLAAVTALDPARQFDGRFDILNAIIQKVGMQRLHDYLEARPDLNGVQQQRVIAAFLDKYAIPERVEQEIDLPGWTAELVDELTDAYDEDVEHIEHVPGVRVLMP